MHRCGVHDSCRLEPERVQVMLVTLVANPRRKMFLALYHILSALTAYASEQGSRLVTTGVAALPTGRVIVRAFSRERRLRATRPTGNDRCRG